MKDTRGVERGACKNCPECEAYEIEENAVRSNCNYCNCPATGHRAIEASQPTTASNSRESTTPNSSVVTLTPVSASTPAVPVRSSSVFTLDVDNVTDPFLQSLLVQQTSTANEPNTDEIFLPIKLPRKCEVALEKRDIDYKVKSGIVREVVSNLMGRDQLTPKCLEKAAKKMVTKWSPLKDVNDPNNEGLLCMLRKRRDRLNGTGSDRASTSSNTEMTALDAKQEMYEKWSTNHRTAAAHKHLMVVARPLRKVESKKLPGLQLLKAYPALGINDVLLQEFYAEIDIDEDKARENWRKTMEPLKQYHQVEKKLPFLGGTLDEETLWILENMHLYNIWFKETNREKRTARVLELFPENTPPAETQPKPTDAPRLIGIGSQYDGTLSLNSFIDSEPVFSEENPFKAMLLLLAIYFVVGIKWPPLVRLPLIFLTCAIGCLSKVRLDVVRNQKFVFFFTANESL